MELTWEQKLAALQALGEVRLAMRKPGDWYVASRNRRVSEGHMLVSRFGNGPTPQAAVEDEWDQYTSGVKEGQCVVVESPDGKSRAVRWNGFMWADVEL